jgi:hypothetical protein
MSVQHRTLGHWRHCNRKERKIWSRINKCERSTAQDSGDPCEGACCDKTGLHRAPRHNWRMSSHDQRQKRQQVDAVVSER